MATNNREQKYIFVPLKKNSESVLKLQRIESMTGDGVPDVIGTNRKGRGFWLEMKFFESWPARATTLPFKSAFEKGQQSFLTSWSDWKFSSFVLLKVDSEKAYYLVHPSLRLKEYTKHEILAMVAASGSINHIIKYLEELS